MIRCTADKNSLSVDRSELLTSGSLNVNFIQFTLSADWNDLSKVVCFRINGNAPTPDAVMAVDSPLDDDLICVLPYAMTVYANVVVQIGIYGVDPVSQEVILPTIWATLGTVRQGVIPSENVDINPPEIIFPGGTGGLNEKQVLAIISKYMMEHPVEYTDIKGVPEAITNRQLEEILK